MFQAYITCYPFMENVLPFYEKDQGYVSFRLIDKFNGTF
jgi:hypothetical protein